MARSPTLSTLSTLASQRSTATPRPRCTSPTARIRASRALLATPLSTHTLAWSRAAATTWRRSGTCSCTSTVASFPGRASRRTRRRRSTRRSWRARGPRLWKLSARATRQSFPHTSTIAAPCALTTARTTPTSAGSSRISSGVRASTAMASSTGHSPHRQARARAGRPRRMRMQRRRVPRRDRSYWAPVPTTRTWGIPLFMAGRPSASSHTLPAWPRPPAR
mmetsp:Transcript_63404/g.200305  ORF Transcript_63404/g.200305 Transcript_63404/m.200305 type:complete len:221 (+) Transcript_63404:255-917(+)